MSLNEGTRVSVGGEGLLRDVGFLLGIGALLGKIENFCLEKRGFLKGGVGNLFWWRGEVGEGGWMRGDFLLVRWEKEFLSIYCYNCLFIFHIFAQLSICCPYMVIIAHLLSA